MHIDKCYPGQASRSQTYEDFNLILGALDNVARHALEHADLADDLLAQEVADLDIIAVHVHVDGEMGVHGLESVPVALFNGKRQTCLEIGSVPVVLQNRKDYDKGLYPWPCKAKINSIQCLRIVQQLIWGPRLRWQINKFLAAVITLQPASSPGSVGGSRHCS